MEGIYGKMFRLIIRIHNFPGNGTGYGPYGRSIEADLRIRRNGPAVCRIVFHAAGKCYTRRSCKKQSFFHNELFERVNDNVMKSVK